MTWRCHASSAKGRLAMDDDLRDRLIETLNTTLTAGDGGLETATSRWDRHDKHRFLYCCVVCRGDVPAIVDAIQPELDALIDRAEQAEAQVAALQRELANRDLLLEKYRETISVIAGQHEEAKAEREVFRLALSESDLGAQILAQWETIAAADADRDRLEARVAALREELDALRRSPIPAEEEVRLRAGIAEAVRQIGEWMNPDSIGPLFAPGHAAEVERTLRAYIGEHVIAALEGRTADPEETNNEA